MASYQEFAQYMAAEFGADNFNIAFKAINENKQLVYADDGNYQQLLEYLSGLNGGSLFKTQDEMMRFADYASLFIMVNNMAQ